MNRFRQSLRRRMSLRHQDRWIREDGQIRSIVSGKCLIITMIPVVLLGTWGDDHLKALAYAVNNLKIAVRNFYDWYAEGMKT